MECTSALPPGSKTIRCQVTAQPVWRGLCEPLSPCKQAGEPHPHLVHGWQVGLAVQGKLCSKAYGYKAKVAECFLLLSRSLSMLRSLSICDL